MINRPLALAALHQLHPELVEHRDFTLAADGSILAWTAPKRFAQPAPEQLAAAVTALPVPAAPARTWQPLDFFLRFTDAERHAVYAAAAQSPQIQDFVTLGSAAGEIHSDNPQLVAAIAAFVGLGILTAARRDAILGA